MALRIDFTYDSNMAQLTFGTKNGSKGMQRNRLGGGAHKRTQLQHIYQTLSSQIRHRIANN